ncbi:MAG TPA: imidazolonepropionase [Candidatus Lumbricidophila sp.]|nr:imidazolonepropionase [Candidatus Lumbricidophila sp.]
MTAHCITNIGELTTNTDLGRFTNAAVVIEGERIIWVGAAAGAPACDTSFDAGGRALLPGWVDSHTHLVFAGERGAEFAARMAGQKYSAGGIHNTVSATRHASDAELRANLTRLRDESRAQGTTWFETKTGYGLDTGDEERCARIAAEFTDDVTFLGAHVVPDGIGADEYVDLVCGDMLTAVRPYVRWIDVFCERAAFDADQSRRVLEAGRAAGLGLRVHGNQLREGPGVALAVALGAASVDHLNHLTAADIDLLANSDTVATFLPACDLSTREPFGPARELLDRGATIALASNCNPGSSYTTSMPFCVATAVLQMHLTVEEAVRAATWGGAAALRRHNGDGRIGCIAPGARADLHLLDAPSITYLAYRPGVPLTHTVWIAGEPVVAQPATSCHS